MDENDLDRLETAILYGRLDYAASQFSFAKGLLEEKENAETAASDCRFINMVISWIETKKKSLLTLHNMTEDDVYDLLPDEAD